MTNDMVHRAAELESRDRIYAAGFGPSKLEFAGEHGIRPKVNGRSRVSSRLFP